MMNAELDLAREIAVQPPEPVEFTPVTPAPAGVWLGQCTIGAVGLESLTMPGEFMIHIRRTPSMIRRSDPETYRVLYLVRGRSGVRQRDSDIILSAGELGFYDSSQPSEGWWHAAGGGGMLLAAVIPHRLISLPPNAARALAGSRLAESADVSVLVASMLTQMVAKADSYGPATATRLSAALVDLITALLCDVAGEPTLVTGDTRQRILLRRVQAFIEQRLGDPGLSPSTVAAAHHIAPRTLHRLFQDNELTVSGWIRHRRLERCRHALSEPCWAGQPIAALAARFGFTDTAHFTRAFRAAYGLSPGAYRHASQPAPAPPGGRTTGS